LVGVSYLLNAEADADGQPKNPPFPKSLANWHRHENICVLPDRSTPSGLNEDPCKAVAKPRFFNSAVESQ